MNALDARGTTPGARFVDPHVLARISNLELLARVVVEGFINGLHRSPNLGASMDFAEHRAYMPGDDIRRIDWRLYARSDRYYIKEFEADTNANFSVLVDVSKSMSFSSRKDGMTKLDYARYIAACLIYFSSKQRDRVGFASFAEDIITYVPPSAKHLTVILHELDRMTTGVRGTLGPPLRKLSESFRRRSIICLISDLYEDPPSIIEAINQLRGKGNDIMVMHVLDPAEIEFPYDDPSNFQDLESDERIPVVPGQFSEKYRALIQQHITSLGKLFGESGVDYAVFDTSKPLDDALFRFLARREQLSRVR
jgi:uncharacterized protein (DUF58 family)